MDDDTRGPGSDDPLTDDQAVDVFAYVAPADTQEATLTMDDFFASEVAAADVAQAQAELLPLAGTWLSAPDPERGMTMDYGRNAEGRRMVSVSGLMTHKKTGTKAFIRARMSPDVRFKDDGVTHDWNFAVWSTAVAAYTAAFGEAPKSDGHVIEYMQRYPAQYVGFRVGVPTKRNPIPDGEPGFLVKTVLAVRG